MTEFEKGQLHWLEMTARAFMRIADAQERRNNLLTDSNENQQEGVAVQKEFGDKYSKAMEHLPELVALKTIMEEGMPLLIDIQAKLDAFANADNVRVREGQGTNNEGHA